MPTPCVKATLLNIAKHAKPPKLRLLAVSILSTVHSRGIELPLGFGLEQNSPERLYMALASSPKTDWKTKLDAMCGFLKLMAEKDQNLRPIVEVIENNTVNERPGKSGKSPLLGDTPKGHIDRTKPLYSKLLQ